jgi:hypothetical protein
MSGKEEEGERERERERNPDFVIFLMRQSERRKEQHI